MYSCSFENVGSDLDAAWTEKKMISVKLLHEFINTGSTGYNISDGLYSLSHSNLVRL